MNNGSFVRYSKGSFIYFIFRKADYSESWGRVFLPFARIVFSSQMLNDPRLLYQKLFWMRCCARMKMKSLAQFFCKRSRSRFRLKKFETELGSFLTLFFRIIWKETFWTVYDRVNKNQNHKKVPVPQHEHLIHILYP